MNKKTHWHLVRAGPAGCLEGDSAISITGEADGKSGLEESWAGLDSATVSTEVGIDSTSETGAGGDSELGVGSGSEVGTRIGSDDGVEAKSEDGVEAKSEDGAEGESEDGAEGESEDGVGRDSIEVEEEVEAEFDSFELG
jgi:hypothetical protein